MNANIEALESHLEELYGQYEDMCCECDIDEADLKSMKRRITEMENRIDEIWRQKGE